MFGDLAPSVSVLLASVVGGLLALIVSLWVSWAIIRGAVLSALRKHSDEQRAHERASRGGQPISQ
ncbi:hypothetical protein ELQ90_03040 [Labedella phragmitis]|uniref:Uncharacterized protein n=1 Tax=Labedella phragmitis TaxID=2498849 RepID=A0A3S3Z6K6_9MICO|nr:hypothetical protein [Labedella phragmitis]RWZ52925.1 hypothetical protein ELQ90_03040 [Labedella phragmitis]